MIRSIAFSESINSATTTALTAVTTDRTYVGGPHRIRSISGICSDDLDKIVWSSAGLPTMGLEFAGGNKNTSKKSGKIDGNSVVTVTGLQNSGGALEVGALINYSTGQMNRLNKNGKACSQTVTPTGGATALGVFLSLTNFKGDKKYQIESVRCICAVNQIFAVLRHPDFPEDIYVPAQGLTGTAGAFDENEYVFDEEDVPQFSGSQPLQVALWGVASAGDVTVQMVEV